MTMSKLFDVREWVADHTTNGEISVTLWVDLKDGTQSFVIFPSSIRRPACVELVREYNGILTSCEWDDMIKRISIL